MSGQVVKVVEANVQGLVDQRKRTQCFLRWTRGKTASDLVLLTETGCRTAAMEISWAREVTAVSSVYGARFSGQAAMLWRRSAIMPDDPTDVGAIASTMPVAIRRRMIDARFVIAGQPVLVVCVYAPTDGARSDVVDRAEFFVRIRDGIAQAGVPAGGLVIGGDWNCVLDPTMDSSAGPRRGPDRGVPELHALLIQFSLVDTWRALHKTPLFTNVSRGAKRRLDVIYASEPLAGQLSAAGFKDRHGSSHHSISASFLVAGGPEIGPSSWRLNTELLRDPALVDFVTRRIERAAAALPDDSSANERWDELKMEWREALIEASRIRARMVRVDDAEVARGAARRARLPPTSQMSLGVRLRLKAVRAADLISGFKVGEGVKATAPAELLGHATGFFADLFSVKATEPEAVDELLNGNVPMPTLDRDDRAALEEPVSLDDLDEALKKLHVDVACGPDGLPAEAYKTPAFWRVLGPFLLASLHEGFDEGLMSASQRQQRTVLLHKTGDKELVQNYRPITISNVDAKIASLTLVIALRPVIGKVISDEQVGFIPRRRIDWNISMIQELFESDVAEGHLLFLDFAKAYDRISLEWLRRVLERYGFGPRFCARAMASVTGLRSSIVINGWTGPAFDVASGVAQGSPAAPLLFALALDPFLRRLNACTRGIQLRAVCVRARAMADDVVAGLRDSADAYGFNLARDIYERASGSLLSEPKTFAAAVGRPSADSVARLRAVLPAAIPIVDEPSYRYLGPRVGRAPDAVAMWQTVIDGIRVRLSRIPLVDLPLAERCRIVSVYGLTKASYLDRFVPCPAAQLDEIDKLVLRAIWKDGPRTINPQRLRQNAREGGFGLTALTEQLRGFRAEHVRRLAFDPSSPDLLERRAVIEHLACSALSQLAMYDGKVVRKAIKRRPDKSWRAWSWTLVLGQRSPEVRSVAKRQLEAIKSGIGARWSAYLDAWHRETGFSVPRDRALEVVTWTRTVGLGRRLLRPFEHVGMLTTPGLDKAKSLNHGSRRLSTKLGPVIPRAAAAAPATADEWTRFWRAVRKAKRHRPVETDTLHRLILRSLHGADHGFGRHDPERPWASSKTCSLCDQATCLDSARQLFESCPAARAIWAALGIRGARPTYDQLVVPRPGKSISSETMAIRAIYVDAVWRARTRRRFAYSASGPIDVDAIARRARARIDQIELVDEDVSDSEDDA